MNLNSISHSIHEVDAQKHFIDHYKYRHEMEIYLHQDKREKVFWFSTKNNFLPINMID